jgi:hypothetical protein
MFSGICWMRNLRTATTVLWRPTLRQKPPDAHNIVLTTPKDLGSLAGLTVLSVLSVGLSTVGSSFATRPWSGFPPTW